MSKYKDQDKDYMFLTALTNNYSDAIMNSTSSALQIMLLLSWDCI